MQKLWRLFPQDAERAFKLSQELKLTPLTAQVLINRGLNEAGRARQFLKPSLSYLRDPFEIPHIKSAAERVLKAAQSGEKVLVYGDYDVDGVTGTVIMLETLRHLGMKPEFYIPHRYGEGYSLNSEAVKKFKDEGVKLIITVDCGIASLIEIELANSFGMEVIVTDHHNLPAKLPNAFSLVNPKLIKEEHPSKYLSGAGVAFKFAWALLRSAGDKENGFLTDLLDLAALGTVADVVPLTDENRILAVVGINRINEKKRLGLKHLAEAAGISGRVSIDRINFGLSPRINASGRLEHASLSVKLLTSTDPVEARTLAQQLNSINTRRQGIGGDIQEEVFSQLKVTDDQKIIVASGEGWHPGVIGIVASRVVDAYFRPTVLIGINEGVGRGSARSIEDFNIFAVLDTCRDLFSDFGGHEGAAGFEIDPGNIPELKRRLEEKLREFATSEIFTPKLEIDCELDAKQITLGLIKELEALAPHGQGNPAPVFMTRGLKIKDIKKVGNNGGHLKLRFSNGLESIGFRLGELANGLSYEKTYDIAYNLESNEWNGFESAQLNLIDIRENQ
ncbi:single-stranded-DNA-specific exonuclease RecJ [Candidatus Saganbacteria bacterium]|nr:single-stranded-DNA-specific exonuclease RecJ [Candidatus Saganbacteria bacterium]